MDARVLENIKRASLRVKNILDESEALLRELKSRRARTPELVLDQELPPSNEVSDIEGDEGHAQEEDEEQDEQLGQNDELDQVRPQLEELEQVEHLNESRDTESTQGAENDAYVSSDDEEAPLYRKSRWPCGSCCCRRA